MEQEYRISTWNKFFYGFFALIIFGASIFFFYVIITKNLILLVVPLSLLIISVLIVINFIRRKLVIDEKSLLCVNLFSKKELNLSSIKGYRFNGKMIKVEPISETDAIINIGNYIDFENSESFIEWIIKNFKDLDALDLEIENHNFLKDSTFGFSETERLEKLKTTKEIATAYNFISGFLAFIFLFIKNNVSYIILLTLPIIGIILLFRFDLIKFLSNPKRSIYAYIFIGFSIPCFTLLLKTSEFKILSFDNIWLSIGIIFSIMFGLLCFKGINKSVESVLGQIILMLIVSVLYGFASVRTINCVFDKSREIIYNANVIDQHISSGRHTTYYLKLGTWGPQNKNENVEVSKKMYNKTQIGDTVNVKYKEGFLKSPWFVITSKQK